MNDTFDPIRQLLETAGFRMSASLEHIAPALVRAQKKFGPITRNKTAKIRTKTGSEYSYQYADLADVFSVTTPSLTDEGIATLQVPQIRYENPTKILVSTMLLHESGEWILSAPLEIRSDEVSAQGMGIAITYARRYSAQSLLGVATEDNDAAGLGQPPERRPQARQAEPRPQQQAAPAKAKSALPAERGSISAEQQVIVDRALKNITLNGVLATEEQVAHLNRMALSKVNETYTAVNDLASADVAPFLNALQTEVRLARQRIAAGADPLTAEVRPPQAAPAAAATAKRAEPASAAEAAAAAPELSNDHGSVNMRQVEAAIERSGKTAADISQIVSRTTGGDTTDYQEMSEREGQRFLKFLEEAGEAARA